MSDFSKNHRGPDQARYEGQNREWQNIFCKYDGTTPKGAHKLRLWIDSSEWPRNMDPTSEQSTDALASAIRQWCQGDFAAAPVDEPPGPPRQYADRKLVDKDGIPF